MNAVRRRDLALPVVVTGLAFAAAACEPQRPQPVEPLVLTPAAATMEAAELSAGTAGAARGATGRITGMVLDAETGQPVGDVRVIVSSAPRRGAITAHNGRYFFINVPPGEYTLTIERAGYEPVTARGVTVHAAQTLVRDVKLRRTDG